MSTATVETKQQHQTQINKGELLISFASAFQKYLLQEFEAVLPEIHRTVLKGINPEAICQQIAEIKNQYNITNEESFEHQSRDFHEKLLELIPQITLTETQQQKIKKYIKCLIKYSD